MHAGNGFRVGFGVYTSSGPDQDGTGTLAVTCEAGQQYALSLDAGSNYGLITGIPSRRMISRTDLLGYTLYQDAVRTIEWGGTGGAMLGLTGTGSLQPYTIYGRIPGSQTAPLGSYSDMIIADIVF